MNGITTEVHPLNFPTSMTLGYGETFKSAEVSVDVKWDERRTLLHSATLIFSAHSFRGFLSIRAMEARLFIMDHLAIAHGWTTWEGGCITKSAAVNITAYLINGTNKFRLELAGSWELNTAGIDAISARLEVEFTGVPPTVKPSEPEWVTYIKWGAIGVVAVVGVYLGIRAYEASRKKGG